MARLAIGRAPFPWASAPGRASASQFGKVAGRARPPLIGRRTWDRCAGGSRTTGAPQFGDGFGAGPRGNVPADSTTTDYHPVRGGLICTTEGWFTAWLHLLGAFGSLAVAYPLALCSYRGIQVYWADCSSYMPSIEPPVHEIAGREPGRDSTRRHGLAAFASTNQLPGKGGFFISSSSHLLLLAYSTLTFIDGPIWPWRVVTKQTFPALARRAAPRPLIGKGREKSELPKESIGPGKKKRALSRHSSLSLPRHHYHRSWPRAPPSHAFTSPSPRAIATTSATALKPLLRHPIRSAV